ncbi:MAG TPA: hypothetical protein PJ982_09680 [Lacipirellulaceae bacterium]|nr:hypothetical protein [Lacipirellulaceae bacterium]
MFATSYSGTTDANVIDAWCLAFEQAWATTSPVCEPMRGQVKVERVASDVVVERLRRVPQYSAANVHIELVSLPVRDLSYLPQKLLKYRHSQVNILWETLRSQITDFECYEPAAILLLGGRSSILTPPIVEPSEGRLVVLNGNHRVHRLREFDGNARVWCYVVTGVGQPLPGDPVEFDDIEIEVSAPRLRRVRNWTYDLMRHIERSVHPPEEVFVR